jgi:hypothetical protein
VSAARRRSPEDGSTFAGTALRTSSGGLMLTTRSAVKDADQILFAVQDAAPMAGTVLSGARIFRIKGERRKELPARRGPDLSRELAVLEGLSSEGAFFWFTDGGAGHPSRLVLATSRGELKTAAASVEEGKDARRTRGTLVASPKGWLEFRARTSFDKFVDALAEWTGSSVDGCPGLVALRNARMTLRSADGELQDRQRNDNAWAQALPTQNT